MFNGRSLCGIALVQWLDDLILECNLWMLVNHALWQWRTLISAFILKHPHFESLKVSWLRTSTQLLWLPDLHHHLGLRSWLWRLWTFALYGPEVACLWLFQAKQRLHSELTCVNILLLKTHLGDNHASRCNGVILWCLLLQYTDCRRVSSIWLRWIRYIIAFRIRVRRCPPICAVATVHYYLLLLMLLLRKSWGYAIVTCYHFTAWWSLMLKLNLLVMTRRVLLVVYIILRRHHLHLLRRLHLLLIWINRTWISWFSCSVTHHEVGEECHVRLIFEQVVIKLFLQELSEHVKLILAGLIHIFIAKFRYNLLSLKLMFTLNALKKSLKVNIVVMISDTPPLTWAERPPVLELVYQYSGDFRIIFFRKSNWMIT